jgi:hypothetical protein
VNQDFLDLLRELLAHEVEFLVVGAHAMAVHGVPRATGDLDVWIRPGADNAAKVWRALIQFGAPVEALGFEVGDLSQPNLVWQLGVPPQRIDVLTSIDGVAFSEAYEGRAHHPVGGLRVPFLGLQALRANKAATGREKDRLDLELLAE